MQPILKINLTNKNIAEYIVPPDWVRDYIGGSSLAARILYEDLVPEIEPLSPDAPLLFLNGPLTGTAGPSVGRFVICGRSPATKLWGESNCGGFWGPELRKAGYDGLWITGRSEKPAYLWIEDNLVEIRDAEHLWGEQTYQTQTKLIEEIGSEGKIRVAAIGPAGESQIPFALILTDHGRVAGRTGMGAVMGSKKLKAVAVRGTGNIPVDSIEYNQIRSEVNREMRVDNLTRALRELGTAGSADYLDYLGDMPKRYFQKGVFEEVFNITGATMSETILTGVSTCHACVIACGRVVQLEDGEKQKGPEYETIVGFGPNLWIDDLPFITRMGELCDLYGMDTISLSNTIGLAITLFDRGIITEIDTGGINLKWGNPVLVETLVKLTAHKEGFGYCLAEGALSFGKRFNAQDLAIQVNGLELAFHDPRGASGMALAYATSPRGGCHNQSDYFLPDIYGHVESRLGLEFFDRHVGAEKSANVALHQDWRTVFNALVMCYFANVPPLQISSLVTAATGMNYTLDDLMEVGERAWNLKRIINNQFGLTAKDDTLPKPLRQPYEEGGAAGYQVPLEEMLAAYYTAREWDPSTGYPTISKLRELGLDWVKS